MPFLDFLKSPNQSQSLFCLAEGHRFGSGKDSASHLSVRHVVIFPKTFLGKVGFQELWLMACLLGHHRRLLAAPWCVQFER